MVLVALIFLLALSVLPPAATAAWYNPSWPYRQNITINCAYVTGTGVTLTNFPVLVSITDTYLTSSLVQSNGNDILFTASDGATKLPHEIENFTQSTGTLVAWVNVPSVTNSTNTTIYMYYGNPSAGSQQNATGVWDSNYNAVWHLKQNPAGTAPQELDSTSNANSATSGGGMTAAQQVVGKINGGLIFDGFNDYLTTNYVQTAVVNYTIEAWMKTSNTTQVQAAIVQDRGTNTSTGGTGQSLTLSVGGTYPGSAGTAGDVAYGVDSNGIYVGDYSTKLVDDNTWHQVVGTWSAPSGTAVSPTQFTIYIDGVAVTETAATTAGAATSPLTGLFGTQIAQHQPWTTFFNGTLDEIRISKILRSASWISTEYNNQNSPGTFLTVYPPEYSTITSGFTGSPTSGLAPLTVQFNVTNMNLIANNATYVNWTFGDGSVANLSSPAAFNASHTYSSGGTYTVSESVANAAATSITTLSNYITVSSWTNANGCWTATVGNQNLVMWNATGISTWTAPTAIMPNTWYLVVAGGGGGGSYGGGGGAGGFLNGTLTVLSGSTYPITVGASGTAGTATAAGGNGGNSVFATITATGGGGGGSSSGTAARRNGGNGGSGGGGARGTGTNGTGIAGQGMYGGTGQSLTGPTRYLGGGGGGGTVLGGISTGTAAGNGGGGNTSSITGSPVTYAGGGGGGAYTGLTAGSGGSGGGGAGSNSGAGSAGTPNTGGGGGGGNSGPNNGGIGGTGIVIISYSLWNQTVSGFTGSPTSGLAPLSVQFYRTIPNDNATMWNWSFGDGSAWFNTTTVTAANASHTYNSGGTYTVTFIAQNPGRQNTTVQSNYITVGNTTVSGFTGLPTSGLYPLTVQFNVTNMNLIANNATYVNWTFGDGSVANLTSPAAFNASHTYTSGGTYTVSESVANPYYTNITTLLNYIAVYNTTTSGFTGSPTSGLYPLSVQFNLTSMFNNATYVNWSFGDGSVANESTLATFNASHTYTSGGTYTVIETAANPYSTSIATQSNYIAVYNTTTSGFTGSPTSGLYPLTVQFNLTNMANNATYVNWSFGDGSVANLTSPAVFNASHTYSSGGTYTVSESAANPYNTSIATQPNYITVYNQTVSGFTGTPTSGIAPLAVQFYRTIPNDNATMWNWSFGDNLWFNTTTLTAANASHTYSGIGSFTVIYIASNTWASNTTTATNYITTSPYVAMTLNEPAINLALIPGSPATDASLGITVSANAPFTITVADNTARGTGQGYMGNYTSSYVASPLNTILSSPIGLAGTTNGTTSADTLTTPISTAQTLYVGNASVTNQLLAPNIFTQPVAVADPVLPTGSTYRIDLLYTVTLT